MLTPQAKSSQTEKNAAVVKDDLARDRNSTDETDSRLPLSMKRPASDTASQSGLEKRQKLSESGGHETSVADAV